MFRFVDLFAGLGGFHVALESLGGTCVFASELDDKLRSLYELNFSILPHGDIRLVDVGAIPKHDVLCAGFPCQSFSKAGSQEGLDCTRNGDLVKFVRAIIEAKEPRVFMLENVPNLLKHAGGKTWRSLHEQFSKDYEVTFEILSPAQFGIPQVRERMFIVGARRDCGGLGMFSFPEPTGETPDLRKILDKKPGEARELSESLVKVIDVWNKFVKAFPVERDLPSFPIWAMEFGATYPTTGLPPMERTLREMRQYRGSFGKPLSKVKTFDELATLLPHHAMGDEPFPQWKQAFIRQNRELWAENQTWILPILEEIQEFPHSMQKLEWNCKGCDRDLWKHVLQVRASGIRAKRATTAPSLIAMTTTQVPIIAWENRYMTPRECAALQSLETLPNLPATPTRAYKALGNAVNARLVRMVAERLLRATDVLCDQDANEGLVQVA